MRVYEAIVKGENIPEPGIPESFKVLIKEMQALCLNVEVLSHDGQEIEMRELDEETFRTVEELGIDISRPERGSDEEDAARAAARARAGAEVRKCGGRGRGHGTVRAVHACSGCVTRWQSFCKTTQRQGDGAHGRETLD